MDKIELQGIRCYGYSGYLPEERVLGQWFEVDVTLWRDLSAPGSSDRLEDTCDYRQAIATVQTIVKTEPFNLIERLSDRIAQAILDLNLVERVDVRLTKLHAPIPDFDGRITITITRTKQDFT